MLHDLVSERIKKRQGVGPCEYRSPRKEPHFEPLSLESKDIPSRGALAKYAGPRPYVGVFRLRGPITERVHV